MADDKLSVKIEVDTSSVDKAVKKLQNIDFGLEPKGGKSGGTGVLAAVMERLSGMVEKIRAPIDKFATKAAISGIPSAEGGETGMGMGDLIGLVGGLGEGLMAALGPIAGVALIAKGIMDAIKPISEMISLAVAVLVLPLAMMMQSVIRPLLFLLLKAVMAFLGPVKRDAGAKLPTGAGGEGGSAAVFNFSDLTTKLNNLAEALGKLDFPKAATTAGDAINSITNNFVNPLINGLGDIGDRIAHVFDMFIPGFKEQFDKGMAVIGAFFGELAGRFSDAWGRLNTAWDWLNKMAADILKLDFLKAFQDLITVLANLGMAVLDLFLGFFQAMLVGLLGPLGLVVWNVVITPIMELLAGLGKSLWDGITGIMNAAWKFMAPLGTWLWNTAIKTLQAVWDALTQKDLASAIFNSLMGVINAAVAAASRMLSTLGGLLGDGDKKSGHDMVIAPGGNIISTDPADYLIATKNPQDLAGGKGGITFGNINITIEGSASKSDAASIAKEVWHELELNLKRTGYNASSR